MFDVCDCADYYFAGLFDILQEQCCGFLQEFFGDVLWFELCDREDGF